MKKAKQTSVYFLILFLILQYLPLGSFDAANASNLTDSNQAVVFAEEVGGTVELYAENSIESNVSILLEDDTNVTVLEEESEFTFLEYTDENTDIVWNGFVENSRIVDLSEADDFRMNRSGETEVPSSEEIEEIIIPEEIIHDEESLKEEENDQIIDDVMEENQTINLQEASSKEEMSNAEFNQKTTMSMSMAKSMTMTMSVSPANSTSIQGIALANPTHVYQEESTSSKSLKSYAPGTVLKYETYTADWHKAVVYINGNATRGYIKATDVEVPVNNPVTYHGVGVKSPTRVYQSPSTGSSTIRSYAEGSILKYQSFVSGWYKATVYINGKATTGYINANDVVNSETNTVTYHGVGLKSPTRVYQRASTGSATIRSYAEGSILKYQSFVSGWYKATVYINGKATTGYINANDVVNSETNPVTYHGVGLKSPTRVYQSASTGSATLRSYAEGSILKYQSFVNGWYKATVYINGKATTGYIRASDVENATNSPVTLQMWGKANEVNVYSAGSRNTSVLRSYSSGAELKVQTFTSSWYKATVYLQGKPHTGYISVSDVMAEPPTVISYTQYDLTLMEAVNAQIRLNPPPQTDLYRNNNGYVHSSLVDIVERGAITSDGVRFRTSPRLANDNNVYGTFRSGTTFTILETVTGDTTSGSNLWYKINYNNETLYVHTSLVQVTQAAVLNSNTNIRELANTSSHSYGISSRNTEYVVVRKLTGSAVNGNTEWYEIRYNVVWRNAKIEDFLKYLDPSQNDRYQHLLLDKTTGVLAAELNNLLYGRGILSGKGQAFIDAGKQHSVNEIYLISHALLETGNGTSELANGIEVGKNNRGELVLVTSSNRASLTDIKKTYNMFGIGANDGDAKRLGAIYAYDAGWFTPEAGIIGGASFISKSYFDRGQNTLYKMRWNYKYPMASGFLPQYATDMGWAVKQVPNLKNLYDMLDNPVLRFDIVQYK